MKIVHINAVDNVGGAARAMYRLHSGLLAQGHPSSLLVGRQTLAEPSVHTLWRQARSLRTLGDRLRDRAGDLALRQLGTDRWTCSDAWRIVDAPLLADADVINLHNLHGGFFNFRALPALARRRPVVWTLHDMWALTGHCAYSYGCERWRDGCHDCPLLHGEGRQIVEPAPPPLDRTRWQWRAKRRACRQMSLHVIAPSQWLADLARQSILGAATVHCVPYGLDLDTFRPVDQAAAREALGLPLDRRIVLACAENIAHGRKGFAWVVEAMKRLSEPERPLLLTVGGGARMDVPGVSCRHLGYLTSERQQCLACSAADVLLFPSLADNLPLVAMESIACGTPVVAFDVGGVGEIVRPGQTGYLARYKGADDLADGVRRLLGDSAALAEMRGRCRRIAEEEYGIDLQVQRTLKVYQEALEHAHSLPQIG